MKLSNLNPEANMQEASTFLSGCEMCHVQENLEETEFDALYVQFLRYLKIKGRAF